MPLKLEFFKRRTHPATHGALRIQEVFLIILEHVYDNGKGRNSLLSLALTARWLAVPALEVLWRDLPSAESLNCMLFAQGGRFNDWLGENYYDSQTPLGRDLDEINKKTNGGISHRAAWHFGLIKSLRWDNPSGPVSSAVEGFARRQGTHGKISREPTLFPNLTSLVWIGNQPAQYSTIAVLAAGHLQEFEVAYEASCATMLEGLETLGHVVSLLDLLDTGSLKPHTLTVSVRGLWTSTDIPQHHAALDQPAALTHRLNRFLQERRSTLTGVHLSLGSLVLSLDLLIAPDVRALANLTSVTLELHEPPALWQVTLPRLRSLRLVFIVPTLGCVDFVRRLSCPGLRHLGLSFGTAGSWRQHHDNLLDAASGYIRNPRLIYTEGICKSDYFHVITSFALEYDHPIVFTKRLPDEDVLTFDTRIHLAVDALERLAAAQGELIREIVMLNPLPSVESLSISFSKAEFSINFWIHQLSVHYPHLHVLSVTEPSKHPYKDGSLTTTWDSTLHTVRKLALALPELHTLTMPMHDRSMFESDCLEDAAKWDSSLDKFPLGPCRNLKRWNVLGSSLEYRRELWSDVVPPLERGQVKKFCKNVRKAFPGLEVIEWSEDNRHSGRWGAVREYMRDHPHRPSHGLLHFHKTS